MRILLSIMALCFCVCLSYKAEADVSYHYTYLVNNIKPNLTVRSKPTSIFSQTNLMPIKLASVQFLTDDRNLKFQTGTINVKERCVLAGYYQKASDCTGAGKNYGVRCADDESMSFTATEKTVAEQYVAGCCDKVYSVLDPKDCQNNSYYSGNRCLLGKGQINGGNWAYECICNRSTYPFGEDQSCLSGSKFDEKDICKSISNVDGKIKTYYKRCCITTGNGAYSQCSEDNHEIGSGDYCIVDGTALYQSCVCNSNYDLRKSDCSTFLLDATDVCKRGSVEYVRYENCYRVCSNNKYEDLDRFYKGGGLGYLYNTVKNLGLMEE